MLTFKEYILEAKYSSYMDVGHEPEDLKYVELFAVSAKSKVMSIKLSGRIKDHSDWRGAKKAMPFKDLWVGGRIDHKKKIYSIVVHNVSDETNKEIMFQVKRIYKYLDKNYPRYKVGYEHLDLE